MIRCQCPGSLEVPMVISSHILMFWLHKYSAYTYAICTVHNTNKDQHHQCKTQKLELNQQDERLSVEWAEWHWGAAQKSNQTQLAINKYHYPNFHIWTKKKGSLTVIQSENKSLYGWQRIKGSNILKFPSWEDLNPHMQPERDAEICHYRLYLVLPGWFCV